jgi:hypothetical protein
LARGKQEPPFPLRERLKTGETKGSNLREISLTEPIKDEKALRASNTILFIYTVCLDAALLLNDQ